MTPSCEKEKKNKKGSASKAKACIDKLFKQAKSGTKPWPTLKFWLSGLKHWKGRSYKVINSSGRRLKKHFELWLCTRGTQQSVTWNWISTNQEAWLWDDITAFYLRFKSRENNLRIVIRCFSALLIANQPLIVTQWNYALSGGNKRKIKSNNNN